MASVLSLPGYANLVSLKDGEVFLTFDGVRYNRMDVVPTSLLSVIACPGPPCTAGGYVAHCMTRQFGNDRHGWPALAHEFVSGEAPPLPFSRNKGPLA